MTIEQIIAEGPLFREYKVLRSEKYPELVGKIYPLYATYSDDDIALEYDVYLRHFNTKDLQPMLHPSLTFKGERIGVGDVIDDGVVYGQMWCDCEWCVLYSKYGDPNNDCYSISADHIDSHTPRYQPAPTPEEIEKAMEVLKKAGKLVDGKVIK